MKYFTNCRTLDELKKGYRRLAMIHHPDHGGDTATMQAINSEYHERFEVLKKQHNAAADQQHQTTEAPEEFINIISALVKIPGLIVELCGCWLWISGDTKPNKEALKAAGCRWSSSKKMSIAGTQRNILLFDYSDNGDYTSRLNSQVSINYGSLTFTTILPVQVCIPDLIPRMPMAISLFPASAEVLQSM